MSLAASLFTYPSPTSRRRLGAVRTVQIEQTEGKHTLLTIDLDLAADIGINSLHDSPGLFTLTSLGVTYTYHGYIDVGSPGRVSGGSQGRSTTVYLMGETNVMRNSHARSWRAINPYNIARDVLDEYQLGLEMDQYEGVMQFISQTGEESDWQFLVRLADEMGYAMVSDGVVIRFVNVFRELQRAPSRRCPVFYLPPGTAVPSNVDSMSVRSTGSPTDGNYRHMELSGITETGTMFSLNTSVVPGPRRGIKPSFSGPGTKTYQSMSDAMQEAERVRNHARWAYQLTLASSGTLDARVGRSINCQDPSGLYSGHWYVVDVKHAINVGSGLFKTQVVACREDLDSTPTAASPDITGMSPPEAVLYGSKWRASKQWSRVL